MLVTCTTIRLSTKSAWEPPQLPLGCFWSTNFNSKHWPQLPSPVRPWLPLTATAAKPMLKLPFTRKGALSAQAAAVPPSHTDFTLASKSRSPVFASQDSVGLSTFPLPGHEQLGL